jgi:hypothetical protein
MSGKFVEIALQRAQQTEYLKRRLVDAEAENQQLEADRLEAIRLAKKTQRLRERAMAENQQLRDALRIATREWWSWMESARLGYDDEVPTQDDLDVFAEINALAAVRVEER